LVENKGCRALGGFPPKGLVLFSFDFFNLDATFFDDQSFLIFRENFLGPHEFSSGTSALSAFWQESFSSLELVLHELHLFLQ
jgi:hypothetical protein